MLLVSNALVYRKTDWGLPTYKAMYMYMQYSVQAVNKYLYFDEMLP